MNINIRNATIDDIPFINNILNYAILNTNYNLNTNPRPLELAKQWYNEHITEQYPIIVATVDNKVIGWASLSHFRFFSGYNSTAEVSVYVDTEYQSNGVGYKLLRYLEKIAIDLGYHCLIAVVTAHNTPSIRLHSNCGFITNCTFQEIAYKGNEYIDVTFMSKLLDDNNI